MQLSVKICAVALLCVAAGAVIKHLRPEMSPLLRIAGMLFFFTAAMTLISPIVTYMQALFEGNSFGEYGSIVIKALGIAFLTQICADVCRDCGEGSAASGVELMGKLEILVLCFPMLESLLSTVREVMSW